MATNFDTNNSNVFILKNFSYSKLRQFSKDELIHTIANSFEEDIGLTAKVLEVARDKFDKNDYFQMFRECSKKKNEFIIAQLFNRLLDKRRQSFVFEWFNNL
jgi:hypothetical protein